LRYKSGSSTHPRSQEQQMTRRLLIPTLISLIATCEIFSACIKKTTTTSRTDTPAEASKPVPDTLESLPSQPALLSYSPLSERSSLGKKINDTSLVDVFYALAVCQCLPELQASLVTSLNAQRGALPQALTPAIRREITSNPKLKILDIVPRPFDDFVGGLFVDEMTVGEEISNGLKDKIKVLEPDWNLAGDSSKLHLDGFVPTPGTLPTTGGRFIRLADLWARWGLVLSQGGPWSALRSNFPQRGLLWHELLRVLAEGEYLFGISGSDESKKWGGLTIPVDLQIVNPGPFDPRLPFNQVRFLSGLLDLKLPSNNSLSLARFGGESWSWRPDSILLAEQSLQWWVSARLLNRLRPVNRGAFAKYFIGSNAVLPDDGYQLALLTLPGIDSLLGSRFIDENTRAIQAMLIGQEVGGLTQVNRTRAEPQSLTMLLLALSEWSNELKNVGDLSVSQQTAAQLANAPKSLIKGAQLVVQTLLGEYIRPRAPSADMNSAASGLYAATTSSQELPVRDQAQVLHTLISAEQSLMPSPYLRARIAQLANGLSQRIEELALFSETSKANLNLSEKIWIKLAADSFVKAYPAALPSEAMKKILVAVNKFLDDFEQGSQP